MSRSIVSVLPQVIAVASETFPSYAAGKDKKECIKLRNPKKNEAALFSIDFLIVGVLYSHAAVQEKCSAARWITKMGNRCSGSFSSVAEKNTTLST